MTRATFSMEPYDEARARAALRTLRNRIHRFDPGSLLREAVFALNHPAALAFERMRMFPPWALLKVVERIALAQRGGAPAGTERATERDFHDVVNRVHDFGNNHSILPGDYDSHWSVARTLAFRQLWLQTHFRGEHLSRQQQLFLERGKRDRFNRALRAATGISIEEFLAAASLMAARLRNAENGPAIDSRDIAQYGKFVDERILHRYFAATARTLPELATELERVYALGSDDEVAAEEQMHGQSPLWRFPFVRLGDKIVSLGRPVFWAHVRDYVLEVLRDHDAAWLGQELGTPFEEYLRLGLEHSRLVYRDENWLRRHLSGDSKVVDYVLLLGDVVVLLDAKGVVLPASKRGAVTCRTVTSSLKASVVKAVVQGLETAHRLRAAGVVDGIDFRGREFFFMCVTAGDMYLSVGADFIQNYAREAYAKGQGSIPQDNFFVLSAREWDDAMGYVAAGDIDFGQSLRDRAALNRTQHTMQFSQMLFDDEKPAPIAPYLQTPALELFRRIQKQGEATVMRERTSFGAP